MNNKHNIEETVKQFDKFTIHLLNLDGVVILYHAFLGLLERLSGVGEVACGKALISSAMPARDLSACLIFIIYSICFSGLGVLLIVRRAHIFWDLCLVWWE